MRIKKNIFRNLRTRFDLDVTPPIDLNPSVQLVSQVDPLLTVHEIMSDEATATGLTSYFDVPDDEKWTLLWVDMYGVYSRNVTVVMYVDDTSGPFLHIIPMVTATRIAREVNRLDVMPGWGLQMISSTATSGAIRHTMYVEKQKWTPYVEK